ncbi:dTMP kinase [Nakamurella antarctica]|uniref:Thymidylate kinase n=1 Tax=Nakamurella antarctica TaxID=1902245 RepID=A0A3G8ZL13_9ACTN|nr:dTMP kinase [Nakamurella antarctica]AZI57477.1 dTMP kinase [Nakamurella antarctica]
MGRLIVVEGLDGSGKATLTASLARKWGEQGRTVARLAFPRYGMSVHADLVKDALYGRLGDLSESVYGPALLFALDRQGAAEDIEAALAENDIVLLDRYISSNAAYGSARLGGPAHPNDFAQWVADLEVDRFEIPRPDLQILLDVPVLLAAARARGRAAGDNNRALDSFESDSALQARTAAMYAELAAGQYLSPWRILKPEADGSVAIPADLLGPA